MDNLTHSLVGLTASKAGLERVSPYATAVCIMAANLPDADTVMLFAGRYVYLEQHRGVSHSIVGTLTLSLLLPLAFFGIERLVVRLRGREPRAKLKGLLLCSLALGASHPLLDWTNNYGVRPLLPWDGSWFYGDLVFILDPWIWLMLGGAAFLLTASTRRRTLLWALVALLPTAAILLLPGMRGMGVPLGARVGWVAGLVFLVLAHHFGLARRWGAAVAATALALVVVYWSALSLSHARAVARAAAQAQTYAAADGSRVLKVAAMPMPADPLTWRCAAETERATYRFDVSSMPGAGTEARNERRYQRLAEAEAGFVQRAASDERVRIFLDFARFPVATVLSGPGGETSVQFVDIRFTEPGAGARGDTFAVEIPLTTR